MTGFSILAVGFALGMRHATDADHLAAIATLATRESSLPQALRHGLAWGIGHMLTLLALGGTALALGEALPPHFEVLLECCVGAMLLALGLDVLRRLNGEQLHFHAHRHGPGEAEHLHAHAHRGVPADAAAVPQFANLSFAPHHQAPHRHPLPSAAAVTALPLRSVMIGVMHGMAGSAALILLSLQQAPSIAIGLGYLLLFGLGSMAGMAALSMLIATPLRLSAGSLTSLHRLLTGAIGLFSCLLGAWTLWDAAQRW